MPHKPFTDEDEPRINAALKLGADAKKAIERAERAGLDVTDVKERIEKSTETLRGIKTQFFPNK